MIRKRTMKNGKDLYQVIVKVKGYPHKVKTFPSKREAESWEIKLKAAMKSGHYYDDAEAQRQTLGNAMKSIICKTSFLIILFGCLIGLTGCGGIALLPGRPLRIEGEPVITQVRLGGVSNWAQGQRPNSSDLDEYTRLALEMLWLQDARGEHASIPAFSRISWQLAAIGAPSELLEWAHKAALEEISHARMCFALAEGYGGHSYFVQPIPEMLQGGLDLADDHITAIAKETIFDGCLMEGFFANIASVAASQCEEPAALAALKQIACEEKSHAEFSWAVLEWLVEQHPMKVKAVILNACHDIENHNRPKAISREQKPIVEKANPRLLIKHGRLPDEQLQEGMERSSWMLVKPPASQLCKSWSGCV